MIVQKIDFKNECTLLVTEENLVKEISDVKNITASWSYFEELPEDATIAQFLCQLKNIELACPDHLSHKLKNCTDVMKAVKKSINTAKVDCVNNCLYEIVPEHILLDYYGVKNEITSFIIQEYKKPKIYDHLVRTSRLLGDIKKSNVKIDLVKLKSSLGPIKINKFYKKIKRINTVVDYDIFGTKTGRLTCKKNTFPILNLDKDLRKFVVPNRDLFLEIDINGAELRALFFLLKKPQPDLDIHDWNLKNVFKESITRDEAKKRVFAWLYNDESKDSILNKEYDRNSLKKKFFTGTAINTPYGRNIKCDEYHSINYLLQSFSNDILLDQAYKINNYLKDMNSSICFLMHDSIVLDFSRKDVKIVKDLVDMFENTSFGKTKANIRIGKNLGDLRDLVWKK
jgi:hypothetical protein